MRTFEVEYKELLEWRIARFEESRKLPMDGTGLGYPGQRGKQEKLDGEEYRRRLKALEEKYKLKTA